MKELEGLNLASPTVQFDGAHDISILIGADLYWDFVEEKQIQTSWGVRASKSKLGWLLSGPILRNKSMLNTSVALVTGQCKENYEKLKLYPNEISVKKDKEIQTDNEMYDQSSKNKENNPKIYVNINKISKRKKTCTLKNNKIDIRAQDLCTTRKQAHKDLKLINTLYMLIMLCLCFIKTKIYHAKIIMGRILTFSLHYRTCKVMKETRWQILMAKSKMTPVVKSVRFKFKSLGAVLVGKLIYSVRRFLSILKLINITYYTDSTNISYWIKGRRKWREYITKRLEGTYLSSSNFKAVHCNENPADTKGIAMQSLYNYRTWLKRPKWLSTPFTRENMDSNSSRVKNFLYKGIDHVNSNIVYVTGIDVLLSLRHFSNRQHLYRVTGNMYMFYKIHVHKERLFRAHFKIRQYAEEQGIKNENRQLILILKKRESIEERDSNLNFL